MKKPRPCPDRANVLLIGAGGREHALAWKMKQSPRLGELWVTGPTNAALATIGSVCPVAMDLSNKFQMQRWCDSNDIQLVVVGPEGPLADGITDVLATDDRVVFGPSRAAAQLEASKAYAKEVMRQGAIPTADARTFTDAERALDFVRTRDEPCVVKASGLAAGKGAIVCSTGDEAAAAVTRILVHNEFGEAGSSILVEERLTGQEVSVLALVDGHTFWVLDPCQDHKQVGEGDTGPNTGGMGAYCPTPLLDEPTMSLIEREIIVPTIDALRRDGIEYRGVLYAGVMLTAAGPKVLEFNCRFGDPECQPLMARLRGDLVEILWATACGNLDSVEMSFDPRVACCVVMCSDGYPGAYKKGVAIEGIADAESDDVLVFQAGTAATDDGHILTNGGRVLGVTALADDLQAARDRANAACEQIHFDGAFYRRDIADRVLVSGRHTAPSP